MSLHPQFQQTILKTTGASSFHIQGVIQELWSGYGQILRLQLVDAKVDSVVVKHVTLPSQKTHPRGWNSSLSHERKVKSYQVETEWYKHYASKCGEGCKIPSFLSADSFSDEVLLVMEDLDASGYVLRKTVVNWEEIARCLSWLANFHATFLGVAPVGLWQTGTYWHLATRPEELEVLNDQPLKHAASFIDKKLNEAHFQTLVHGDAKLANFCFSEDGKVAAVDFQYVGKGCGMKDVAYFIGSCLSEHACEKLEAKILTHYFTELGKAINTQKVEVNFHALEQEWRELYAYAWTDFHRFLKGWSPGHWKITSYSERLAREVIEQLKQERV